MQPIPPVTPIPNAVKFPTIDVLLPSFKTPKWEPVPIYREDIKELNTKKINTKTNTTTEVRPTKPANNNKENEEVTEPTQPAPEQPPLDTAKPLEMPKTAQDLEIESTVRRVEVPLLGEVPLPREEIVVTAVATAGTAAVASVGATLLATRLFEQVMKIAKPVMKTIVKKIAQARKKPLPLTWSRQRLVERRRKLDKNR